MMWFRTACLMLGLLLGGCAETTYVVEQSKAVSGNTTPRTPYKVGNPYQVNGVWYYPAVDYNYDQTGIASWYGPGFVGHATANGEEYDQDALTAAHKTLPMPSLVRVTNLENGRQIQIRINDRGPFVNDRIIDLSRRGAQLLGMVNNGTAKVRVQIMAGGEPPAGAGARRRRGGRAEAHRGPRTPGHRPRRSPGPRGPDGAAESASRWCRRPPR